MPGYRFCRSDDVPLLVAAHNACWVPHFGAASAITVDDFKRGVRELGLWSSSCMVAFDGDDPIGVLIGAKRDGEANCVQRLAVKPGWERRGHGRHLLTSLVDKAAILGPARVVAEISAEWSEVRGFFERSGFVAETRYADFVLADAPPASIAGDDPRAALVIPVTLDEVMDSGAFGAGGQRAWSRSAPSLRAAAGLEGLAVATDRIEAYVLSRPSRADPGARVIVAIGAADGAQGATLLALLIARARSGAPRLRIPVIAETEVDFATLTSLGFRRERETIGYVATRRT
jgi:GNAT superfamily N-acetyltransferase